MLPTVTHTLKVYAILCQNVCITMKKWVQLIFIQEYLKLIGTNNRKCFYMQCTIC